MKYFIDTEFLEGTQRYRKSFLEALFSTKIHTPPTIDLISIGIVCEDGREYYAISKDFNLTEAWNRYDEVVNKHYPLGSEYNKVYWIRDNVLKPIFKELWEKDKLVKLSQTDFNNNFTYANFKKLINRYGKTNKQIAEEIKQFTNVIEKEYPEKCACGERDTCYQCLEVSEYNGKIDDNVQFYGYYSDYDWVAFCWLFGKMIDLPKGFPTYCIDLQQESDRIYNLKKEEYIKGGGKNFINKMSNHLDYPKQTNEHNALSDTRFNYRLYKFLNTL